MRLREIGGIDIGDGHRYSVRYDMQSQRVIETACVGRWPMTATATGSEWLDGKLLAAARHAAANDLGYEMTPYRNMADRIVRWGESPIEIVAKLTEQMECPARVVETGGRESYVYFDKLRDSKNYAWSIDGVY